MPANGPTTFVLQTARNWNKNLVTRSTVKEIYEFRLKTFEYNKSNREKSEENLRMKIELTPCSIETSRIQMRLIQSLPPKALFDQESKSLRQAPLG